MAGHLIEEMTLDIAEWEQRSDIVDPKELW